CPVQGIPISAAFCQSALFRVEIIHGDLHSRAIFLKPRVGGPAHDRQQPSPGIATRKGADRTEGAQASLLENVLCVRAVACEPARKRKRVLEMGQDDTIESRPILLAAQSRPLTVG